MDIWMVLIGIAVGCALLFVGAMLGYAAHVMRVDERNANRDLSDR